MTRSLFYSRWARTQVTFFLAAVARQCAKAAAKRGSKRVARAPVRQQKRTAIDARTGDASGRLLLSSYTYWRRLQFKLRPSCSRCHSDHY